MFWNKNQKKAEKAPNIKEEIDVKQVEDNIVVMEYLKG